MRIMVWVLLCWDVTDMWFPQLRKHDMTQQMVGHWSQCEGVYNQRSRRDPFKMPQDLQATATLLMTHTRVTTTCRPWLSSAQGVELGNEQHGSIRGMCSKTDLYPRSWSMALIFDWLLLVWIWSQLHTWLNNCCDDWRAIEVRFSSNS